MPADIARAAPRFDRPDALSFIQGARVPQGSRSAAVLILLGPGAEGNDIVLVEKRPDLRNHAGQIAFPGGRIEPTDPDPVTAALREAREEVGVEAGEVEIVGALPSAHIPRSGFDVTSVVGWWSRPRLLDPVDTGEIEAVHHVSVARLLDPENRTTWVHPAGFQGPAFVIGDLYIWGFTAFLLDGVFDLLEWTQPWDAARTSVIPPRFLSEQL